MSDPSPPNSASRATLYASAALKSASIVVLCLVGGIFAYRVASGQGAAALILPAGAALWAAWCIGRSTVAGVVLTDDGLWDTDGTLIAPLDDILGVNRGLLAFKPPNGFSIRLRQRMPAAWVPGLYWRWGTLVGIGGMTPIHPAKQMAQAVEMAVFEAR